MSTHPSTQCCGFSAELSEPALEFETGWGVVTVGGAGAIVMICVLDLAEYLALAEQRNDTLYLIRG